MDFARKQLEKYGWSEGQGLGKNADGILKALKPNLKFDTCGLGHNLVEEYKNPWWQMLYDEAANNIIIKEKVGSIKSEVNDKEISLSANKFKKKLKKNKKVIEQSEKYKNFIKTSKLDGTKEMQFHKEIEDSNKNKTNLIELNDDELFNACSGRTAHGGARHGLKMNAKLARIEKHEVKMIKNLRNVCNIEKNSTERSKKKN